MIPENKKLVVEKALQIAFGVNKFDNIEMLTQGLSSALIFRIEVRGIPYLLRVIMSTEPIGDPTYYFERMKAGADAGLAPMIHYLNAEDRISITDFITAQPFPIQTARRQMAETISKLHALPRFPFRLHYFDVMDGMITKFRSLNIIPEEYTKELFDIYEKLRNVYPRFDEENLVSCHNDLKPENVIFDGKRPWFVDWEAAFLDDRYEDLCLVGNFVVTNEDEEAEFLKTYFGEPADEYQHARFFLMSQMLHVFYFSFLMRVSSEGKPVDVPRLSKYDFRDFHNRIWNGEITLHQNQPKLEYGWVHRDEFLRKAATPRFIESMKIVWQYSKAV